MFRVSHEHRDIKGTEEDMGGKWKSRRPAIRMMLSMVGGRGLEPLTPCV